MIYKKRALTIAVAAIALTALSSYPSFAKDLNPQTRKNLEAAMHGEAYANLKYHAYAEDARAAGNEEVAKLFEDTANVEANEHFVSEAVALGLAKGIEKDLEDSMKGEHYENVKMYDSSEKIMGKLGLG